MKRKVAITSLSSTPVFIGQSRVFAQISFWLKLAHFILKRAIAQEILKFFFNKKNFKFKNYSNKFFKLKFILKKLILTIWSHF